VRRRVASDGRTFRRAGREAGAPPSPPSDGARSRAALADFFENAPVGLSWIDGNGILLRVNRHEAQSLGYAREEMVGRPMTDFHEDPAVVASLLARLTRGETVSDVEARLRRKDGTTCWVRISANGAWEGGRLVRARCVARDVSQRRVAEEALRAAEERTRAILENALDAYVAVAVDGTILGWNRRAEEMFRRSRAEALGRRIADTIFPVAERRRYADALARFVATGEETIFGSRLEATALRADGSEFPVEMSVTPVRVDDEWTFHAFVRDITDRRAAERALRARERASRRLAEALRRLAMPSGTRDPLANLVATLANATGARHVAVSEVEPSGRLRALAAWTDGRSADLDDQPLAGTAAGEVAERGPRHVADGARDAFPSDARLRALGARSYLGTPLRGPDGTVRGVLDAVHDDRLDESLDLVGLLDLFAHRAEQEIGLLRHATPASFALTSKTPAPPAPREDRASAIPAGSIEVAMSTVGLDGIVTSWSAEAARVFGYETDEMRGRAFATLFTPEDVAHGVPDRLLRIAADEGLVRHDGWCLTRDGARVWTELTLSALRRDSGEVYALVVA